MASLSKKTWNKRENRAKKMGRKRKNDQSKRSTVSYNELFAELGEPTKPTVGRKKKN
ncbi:MAG: hypothetical protein V1754_06640 [Pseudomonadota bacterium]